jgi:hypothetical protein
MNMMNESSSTKPAPRILEKSVLSLIGILSLIFVPFCLLAFVALIYASFGSVDSRYKLPFYYSLSFAALFGFLGILLTVLAGDYFGGSNHRQKIY